MRACWLVVCMAATRCFAGNIHDKPVYRFNEDQRELLRLAGVLEYPPPPEKIECVLPDDAVAAPARLWNVTVTLYPKGRDEIWHAITDPIWYGNFSQWRGRTRGDLTCLGTKVLDYAVNWGTVENKVLVRWRRLSECTDDDYVIE